MLHSEILCHFALEHNMHLIFPMAIDAQVSDLGKMALTFQDSFEE